MSETLQDVYTAEEVARAAGVPISSVYELIESGEMDWIAGTRFFTAKEAVQAGRRLRVRRTADVLANAGNCASATVLLVLENILRVDKPRPGEYGVMLAFGPGLTIEGGVVRF